MFWGSVPFSPFDATTEEKVLASWLIRIILRLCELKSSKGGWKQLCNARALHFPSSVSEGISEQNIIHVSPWFSGSILPRLSADKQMNHLCAGATPQGVTQLRPGSMDPIHGNDFLGGVFIDRRKPALGAWTRSHTHTHTRSHSIPLFYTP